MKLSLNNNLKKAAPNRFGAISQPSFKGVRMSALADLFTDKPKIYRVSDDVCNELSTVIDKKFGKFLIQANGLSKEISEKLGSEAALKGVFEAQGDTYKFKDMSFFKRFGKQLLYPFRDAWLDLTNSALEKARKSDLIKDSAWVQKLSKSSVLTKRKNEIEANRVFDTLQGILSKMGKKGLGDNGEIIIDKIGEVENVKKIYHDMFKGKIGSYKTESERALNKIACGLVSGTFAARDFYNITRYHTDDDKAASKAQKKRFRQEMLRSGINAALIFGGMGALSNYTNNKKSVAIATLVSMTLIAELGSRLINKTPILPLSKEKAKKIYEKKYASKMQKKSIINFEDFKKHIGVSKSENKTTFSGENTEAKNQNNNTTKIILKGFMALFSAGVAVGLLKNNNKKFYEFASKISENCSDIYKKITFGTQYVSKDEMDKLIQKLNNTEHFSIADDCRKILEKQSPIERNGKMVYKLQKAKGPLKAVVDILTFPFDFILRAPKFGERTINRILKINDIKGAAKEPTVATEKILGLYKELGKKVDLSDVKFEEEINEVFKRVFSISTSSHDNRKLVKDFLFFNTLIPSYFFVNDFRNHELIETGGEDKASISSTTKTKVGQRFANFFVNNYFINFFLSIFGRAFNSNLAAATLITAGTELANETTIRKMIGVPTKKMSRDELIDFENKNYNDPGLKGKYMRFISSLTGKKPLGEKAKSQKS